MDFRYTYLVLNVEFMSILKLTKKKSRLNESAFLFTLPIV